MHGVYLDGFQSLETAAGSCIDELEGRIVVNSETYTLVMYGPRGKSFSDNWPGIFENSKNDPKTSKDFRNRLPKIAVRQSEGVRKCIIGKRIIEPSKARPRQHIAPVELDRRDYWQ